MSSFVLHEAPAVSLSKEGIVSSSSFVIASIVFG
jgi:hypothetical protein